MKLFARSILALSFSGFLTMAAACGDDGSGDGGPDNPAQDLGTPPADMPATDMPTDLGPNDDDMGTVPTCDPETCANGSCSGDSCVCEAGWRGDLCDELNEPTDDGVSFWFDADAMDTRMLADPAEDFLQAWTSRVGDMMVTAQPANEYPRVLTAGASFANGRPTVTFDGMDDQLLGTWAAGDASEFTVFVVFNVLSGNETIFDLRTLAGNEVLQIRVGGTTDPYQIQALVQDGDRDLDQFGLIGGQVSLGDMVVLAVRVTNEELSVWRDGEAGETWALDTGYFASDMLTSTFVTFGSTDATAGSTEYYSGSLAEAIMFDVGASDGLIQAVSGYLDAKWR